MLEPRQARAREKSIPCVRCGEPSVCDVWEQRACLACEAAWQADPRLEPVQRETASMSLEDACRRWTEATAKWVAQTRRRESA